MACALLASSLQLVRKVAQDPATRSSGRVAEGDGTSVDVAAGAVKTKVLLASQIPATASSDMSQAKA
jgi:hypothetical protein